MRAAASEIRLIKKDKGEEKEVGGGANTHTFTRVGRITDVRCMLSRHVRMPKQPEAEATHAGVRLRAALYNKCKFVPTTKLNSPRRQVKQRNLKSRMYASPRNIGIVHSTTLRCEPPKIEVIRGVVKSM